MYLFIGILVVWLNLSGLSNTQGFPFSFPPILPKSPPVEIKFHSVLDLGDPQITLFDYDGIDDGIEGQLITSYPFDACTPVQNPPESKWRFEDNVNEDELNPTKFWILLTNNLNCDLTTKVSNAVAAKYSAILLVNVENEFEIDPDFFFSPESIVHVRTIGANDFSIHDEYLGKISFEQTLLAELLSFSLTTFLGLAAGIIVVLMLIWCFQILGGNRLLKYLEAKRRGKIVAEALRHTKVQNWRPDANFLNNESCIICLDDFTTSDRVRILQCVHGFHIDCIDPWVLKINGSCPVCKQAVVGNFQNSTNSMSDSEEHLTVDSQRSNETEPLLSISTFLDTHGMSL